MPIKDLTGTTFGRWTVQTQVQSKGDGAIWRCLCQCGTERTVAAHSLLRGTSQSCGCLADEKRLAATRKHQQCGTPEYAAWAGMFQRCYNHRNAQFKNYGARGVTVCDRWKDFREFLKDMGKKPSPRHSIDREKNDGNYEPENCRWALPKQQSRNTRTCHFITINGETKTVTEWAEKTGVPRNLIYTRISRLKWTPEKAVITPARPNY